MSVAITVRLSSELLARVDAAAGDVPRNRWVVRALEAALSEAKVPLSSEQAGLGTVPSSAKVEGVKPAAQPRASESEESEYQRMLRIQRLGSKSA